MSSTFEIRVGKWETGNLFQHGLLIKVEAGKNGPVYFLTCERTGLTTTLTSKDFCKPAALKLKIFEVSGHVSTCSAAELAVLVNDLLKRRGDQYFAGSV